MAQARKKSTAKSKSKPKTRPKTGANPSPERNLNLTGIMMAAVGVLSAIILFSSRSSQLLTDLYTLIRKGFGWGSYFLPILLLGGGILILLRKLEGAPKISPEQIAGISLLYLAGLTTMQFFTFPLDFLASKYIASNGIGGGFIGAYILAPMQSTFGIAGTAIALFAWILLSLSLTLNIPVLELFSWVPGVLQAIKNLYLKLFPPREKPAPDLHTSPSAGRCPGSKNAAPQQPLIRQPRPSHYLMIRSRT